MNVQSVLLLDSSMAPIKTIDWRRAFALKFAQKAHVLVEQTARVSSPTHTFPVPAVLQLKGYVRKSFDKHIRFSRMNVFARDNYTCQYCSLKFPPKKLTIEHVHPRCRGGKATWLNIVSACSPCNQKKEGRTPHEAGMKLLRPPAKPSGAGLARFRFNETMPSEWKPFLEWVK